MYSDARAVWSMAYSGGLLPGVARTEAAQVFRALRAALSATPEAAPVRGPPAFEADGLRYVSTLNGDLHRFHGEERILREGQVVYGLQFSGGGLA